MAAANHIPKLLKISENTKMSIVLFGDDKEFMKSLYFDRTYFNNVYIPDLSARLEDFALAQQFCDSFLSEFCHSSSATCGTECIANGV